MKLRILVMASAVIATIQFGGRGEAQMPEGEAVLIRSLDRAFKPGFLSTDVVRKEADGTYFRSVTTGDAIAKPTFGKPRETTQGACLEIGGTFALVISAGRHDGSASSTILELGDERLNIDYKSMYDLFANRSSAVFDAGSSGFKPMFRTSHFAERAAAQADALPPFGLFTCTTSGRTRWAVAIMPAGMPSGYDLPIRVTPVTQGWIRTRRLHAEEAVREAERQKTAVIRQQGLADDRARSEALRLRPFRAGLRIGSRTNCGIVIAVRDPLVQVQLPPQIAGPSGMREFWAPREELTDAVPPQGCRFGA